MALNRNSTYGQRWSTPSDDGLQGSYKNKSDPTDTQASYLEANVLNDSFDGWQGALLNGYIPSASDLSAVPAFGVQYPANGIADKGSASQIYNTWYKRTQDIVDAKNADIQNIIDGCYFQYFSSEMFSTQSSLTSIDIENATGNTLNNRNITMSTNSLTFAVEGTYFVQPIFITKHNQNAISDSSEFVLCTDNSDPENSKSLSISMKKFHYCDHDVDGRGSALREGASGSFAGSPIFGMPPLAIGVNANQTFYLKSENDKEFAMQLCIYRVGTKQQSYALQTDLEPS